jgi:hypothetical protein
MTSLFTARVCRGELAVHALVPRVLNAPEDLDAAPVQSAAARVQNAAVADQNVGVAAPTVVAPAQNVVAVDLTAAGDHDAVVVHNAGAFPHVAQALSVKVVAHNCARVDPDVARGSRSAPGVQVARGDPFPLAAGSVPDVPAVLFVQADRISRAARDVPQGFRFPMSAVW